MAPNNQESDLSMAGFSGLVSIFSGKVRNQPYRETLVTIG